MIVLKRASANSVGAARRYAARTAVAAATVEDGWHDSPAQELARLFGRSGVEMGSLPFCALAIALALARQPRDPMRDLP